MKIYLWKNFTKRKNSTKRPSDGVEHDINLKGLVNVTSPTIILYDVTDNYNYAYIPEWDRYYYVTECTISTPHVMTLQLSCDVLASFKNAIASYNGYVAYAGSDRDKWIIDGRMTHSTELTSKEYKSATIIDLDTTSNAGTFVLTIANDSADANLGLSGCYIADQLTCQQLLYHIYSGQLDDKLVKLFGSVQESIISAHWVPFGGNFDQTDSIYIGDVSISPVTGIYAHAFGGLKPHQSNLSTSVQIPWIYNDWRDFSDSQLICYLPLIGDVILDTSKLQGETTLNIKVYYDYVGGVITYKLYTSNYKEEFSKYCAVPLATSQNQKSIFEGVGQAASGLGEIALGSANGLAGSLTTLSGVGDIIKGAVSQFTQRATGSGSNGSFATSDSTTNETSGYKYRSVVLRMISHDTSMNPSEMDSICGRPLFDTRLLGSLNGYIQCTGASVPIAGYLTEKSEVDNYINTGFFME